MPKNKRPPPSLERDEWTRSIAGDSWVWVVPLVGKRRAGRVRDERGILTVLGRRIARYGDLLHTPYTRSVAWVEPMPSEEQAAQEHECQLESVLSRVHADLFGARFGQEQRRARLTPADLDTLRAILDRLEKP